MGRFPRRSRVNVTALFTKLRQLQTTDSWNEEEEEKEENGLSPQLILPVEVLLGSLMFFVLGELRVVNYFREKDFTVTTKPHRAGTPAASWETAQDGGPADEEEAVSCLSIQTEVILVLKKKNAAVIFEKSN